jgi:hypothetical protein
LPSLVCFAEFSHGFQAPKVSLIPSLVPSQPVQEEIKVDSAATVKICWGANDGGRQQYYGEAGAAQLVAIHVDGMASAGAK